MALTKGRAKELALRWLDEATLNGQAASSELTADYTDKFDYMMYNVLVYIAAIFRLRGSFVVKPEECEKMGGFYRVQLPEDFMGFNRVIVYNDTASAEIPDFRRESTDVYLIPDTYFIEGTTVEFIYWRSPKKVEIDALDTTELEVRPKAEQLVPLRLAIEATAGSDETNAISAYLEGKFSNMVNNLLGDENDYSGYAVERVYSI